MRRLAVLLALSVMVSACGRAASPAPDSPPALGAAEGRAGGNSEAVVSASAAPSSAPASPSPQPSASGQPSASAQPAPRVPLASISPAKRIGPLIFISQTLNNCGPASIAEILNYFGVQRSQGQVAAVLRPDLPAYGMSLYGVPFYAESVGMRAAGGISGSDELIKAFVANGLPVIVADQVSRSDPTRHFRPIDGYDDQAGYFIGSDPYLGANHQIGYADFDDLWRISTNRWVAIYPPDKQDLVDAILGRYWNRGQALQAGMQRAEQRMAQQPRLPWTWLEMADVQIEMGDLKSANENLQKGIQLGLPFEAHWLQLKLQRASSKAA